MEGVTKEVGGGGGKDSGRDQDPDPNPSPNPNQVLFKPTKATDHPFRATGESAMSYFVGAEAMNDDEYKGEDAALQPYTLTLIPCPAP